MGDKCNCCTAASRANIFKLKKKKRIVLCLIGELDKNEVRIKAERMSTCLVRIVARVRAGLRRAPGRASKVERE